VSKARTSLTRSPAGAHAGKELEALLSRSWERMFPGVDKPEELNSTDRKYWIRHQQALVRTFYELAGAAKTIGDGFTELVEAEVKLTDAKITDLNERRGVELDIEKRETQAKRREGRAEREGREKREDKLLDQEIAERKRFMLMGTVGFCASLALLLFSVMTQQEVGYAGSGAGLFVSCGLWGFGVVKPLHRKHREGGEGGRSKRNKRKR
jgi:hypothetical protein